MAAARKTYKRTVPKHDTDRERRIAEEIVVDAHDAEERAMGWYYYLEDQLRFPFTGTCITKRQSSPLRVKDEVEVTGMADETECAQEVRVLIRWEREGLAVPLSQLKPIDDTDEQTTQAVEDWRYWVKMGYEF